MTLTHRDAHMAIYELDIDGRQCYFQVHADVIYLVDAELDDVIRTWTAGPRANVITIVQEA